MRLMTRLILLAALLALPLRLAGEYQGALCRGYRQPHYFDSDERNLLRTLADICVGCALGYLDFRFAQLGWRAQFSNLARHADKLFARQSFIDTMPS